MKYLAPALLLLVFTVRSVGAVEICGNDLDDDGNGMVDEGCGPSLTTGVCESPLSCGDTGMISWKSGALHYDLPADVSPKVPYGPGIGLRRFYTSAYAPGTGPTTVNHTPLGARWQHTYMTWIDRFQVSSIYRVVLHTSEGRDVYGTYANTTGGWEYYTPQAGYHVMSIRRNTASPNQYQVQLLTGETLYYNSSGQLKQIWDSLPTPNKVLINWTSTSNGNVSTVTDAAGKRRLKFNYTSNLLTSVNYQILISATWTTQQTSTYTFTSGTMTSASIGPSLTQQYAYTGGYLTGITDAAGNLIASFRYNATTASQVDRVDTPHGTVGMEFASTRTGCTSNTILYFNKATATSCSIDSDCGGYLCGGKTGTGSTGTCFSAARCMALSTVNSESVVTTVTPLSSSGVGTCSGACTDVAQYVWSSDATKLNVTGRQDPLGTYTSASYDANGLPTQIAYADTDTDPTNGGYARTTFISYDTTYPGRIAETRRKSDLEPFGLACTASNPAGCVREIYAYGADTQLQSLTQSGWTLDNTGMAVAYSYATTYVHDTFARLTEVDGPVTSGGSVMKTTYDFFSSTDPKLDAYLQHVKLYKDGTNHLDETVLGYDAWGNAISRMDPDGTVSCRTFDANRNYLTQTREAMAGQTDCTTTNGADLTSSWVRDTALRLTQYTRPDGSCVFNLYNTIGQLATVKRRDDCVAASAGDYQSYVYTLDGLVSELDTYNASNVLTAKQPYTYYQSRRLQTAVNPVDSTSKQLVYDARGVVTEVDDEASLGKTQYNVDNDHRLTSEVRYKSGTAFDTWTFLHDWMNDQTSYTDGDSKTVQSVRDDRGRFVKLVTPDRAVPTIKIYDAIGDLTSITGSIAGGLSYTHVFTYDLLGRALTNDYDGACPTGTPQPEIQHAYDSLPPGITCPVGGGCANTAGRLSYVKASLLCSSAYSTTDGSLDQETFYSYDSAGRLVDEYVRDDSGRVADHLYTWSKSGALSQFITPSGATMSWTFGSTGNNSDTDLVTAIAQSGATLISGVGWFPFGPLLGYNQQATIGGVALATKVSRNLAYRISSIQMTNGSTTEYEGVAITEDSKGRVTLRDYFDNSTGVQDSYFMYDSQDRVLCETTNLVAVCPDKADATVKNSHPSAPPFTNAGDWKYILRQDRLAPHTDTFSLYTGTHQISQVVQDPPLGTVSYSYNSFGDRASDSSSAADATHSGRTYTYDARHNLVNVRGQFVWRTLCSPTCTYFWHYYDSSSTFDARDRRVSKTFVDETSGKTQQWFFYYDAADRLTEFQYTPNTAVPGTYSMFQIAWLGQQPVMYTQTDFPGVTVSKRYTTTDETNRIISMWAWPTTGDATRVWAVNPTAWAYDQPAIIGSGVIQPLVFDGQFLDWDNYVMTDNNRVTEPALNLNGHRSYDPFVGGYLQLDPRASQTRSSYVYANSDPVGELGGSGPTLDSNWETESVVPYSVSCDPTLGGTGGGRIPQIARGGTLPQDNPCKPTLQVYESAYCGIAPPTFTCVSDLPPTSGVPVAKLADVSAKAQMLGQAITVEGGQAAACTGPHQHLQWDRGWRFLVYDKVTCTLDCDTGAIGVCVVVLGDDAGLQVPTPISAANTYQTSYILCQL